jgi:hypothetical protein
VYKNEPCESKVANLLQAACESEVPSEKIRLLTLCVAEQEKEVQELKKQYLVLAKAHNELVEDLTNHKGIHYYLRVVVPEFVF